MSDNLFIVPSSRSEFVELARSPQGKLFRKHILTRGENLIDPRSIGSGNIIKIDDEFISTMLENYKNDICDIVQIPLANKSNDHDESPDRNIGEVVGLELEGDKLYAISDIRKHTDDVGKTLLGASAMFHPNYLDTKTGKKVGPTLIHMAVTNRPYITGLEDYEEIVAASNSSTGSNTVFLTAVNQENEKMELNELLAALKDEHGIDVADLQSRVVAGDEAVSMSNSLKEKLADQGIVKLSNGSEVTADDIVGAVAQIATDAVTLSNRVNELEGDKAANVVDEKVRTGYILPANRDTMLEVKLSNPELFEKLTQVQVVKLSNELGSDLPENPDEELAVMLSHYEEVARNMGIVK